MPCESPCVRNIYLQYWFQLFAIHRNGSLHNAALELRSFYLLKSLSAINLNQITITSLVFRLTGSTTIASAFAISEVSSNLQWNCPMTSRRKIIVPRDTADSFVKVSFWFPKGNTLQKRNSRVRAQDERIKCYCNRNEHSYPILTDFVMENKTQTQKTKHSVMGFLFYSWPKHRKRETFFIGLRRNLRLMHAVLLSRAQPYLQLSFLLY